MVDELHVLCPCLIIGSSLVEVDHTICHSPAALQQQKEQQNRHSTSSTADTANVFSGHFDRSGGNSPCLAVLQEQKARQRSQQEARHDKLKNLPTASRTHGAARSTRLHMPALLWAAAVIAWHLCAALFMLCGCKPQEHQCSLGHPCCSWATPTEIANTSMPRRACHTAIPALRMPLPP